MTCKEVMIPNPRCCTIFANAIEAAKIMYEDNVGVVPVIDEATQILIDTVNERDLCVEIVAKGENPKELMVEECMSKNPIACFPEDDIQDAENLMKKHQIRHIPVVDHNGCCIGLIAQADIEMKIEQPQAVHELLYNFLFVPPFSQVGGA